MTRIIVDLIETEESRYYQLRDGKKTIVPGYSKLIKQVYDNPFWTEESAKRGTWIHNRCYDILSGRDDLEWWTGKIRDYKDCMGEILGWIKFVSYMKLWKSPFIIEYPLYSKEAGCASKFDVIFPVEKIGVDIKTGQRHDSHIFQIALLNHLVCHNINGGWLSEYKLKPGVWLWYIVYLSDSGYDAREYPDLLKKRFNIFKSFQITNHWKQKYNPKKQEE